jgi:hypothetical protein
MLPKAQRLGAQEQPEPPEAQPPELPELLLPASLPEAQPPPVFPPEHVVLAALLDAALPAAPQLPCSE